MRVRLQTCRLQGIRGSFVGPSAAAEVNFSVLGRGSAMIQGLRTAIYPTPDLARGKEWYRSP